MRRLRAAGPALVVEGGNALFEDVTVSPAEQQRAGTIAAGIAAAAARMQVDVWVPGDHDLALGLDYFSAQMARHGIAVVAANLERRDGSLPFRSHVVRELGGARVVVVGLVGPPWPARTGMVVRDPVVAAQRVASTAVGPGDMLVLVARLGLDDARRLAQRVPQASVVLVADPRSLTFLPSEAVRSGKVQQRVVPLAAAGRHGSYLVAFDVLARPGDPVWRSDTGSTARSGATHYQFRFVDVDDSIAEDSDTAAWRSALAPSRSAAQMLPSVPEMR